MKNSAFNILIGSALGAELIFFGYFYFYGSNGYKKIKELRELQENIQISVADTQKQVKELEKKIYDFKTYPYYKEKIIRELLQMMHDDEVIYKKPK
ncbi:MAG: septum formation initiator family protein [Candidatus Babeliaceae bacterium]|nr:septum formation initiator family protein [Candidatus Babeliaceae bacterium]